MLNGNTDLASIQKDQELIVRLYEQHMGDHLKFITFTLPKKFYQFQSLTQYEMTINAFRLKLTTARALSTYCVEITNSANVHYHAIMSFRDDLAQISFINSIRRCTYLGFYKITDNPITHKDNLIRSANYLTKDIQKTSKVLHTGNYKPLLIDIIN